MPIICTECQKRLKEVGEGIDDAKKGGYPVDERIEDNEGHAMYRQKGWSIALCIVVG